MSLEVIISVTSSLIALCALCFTVWQGLLTRKHNRISYKPHLTVWSHNELQEGVFALDVINNGLGPAVIKKFDISVDGEVIEDKGPALVESTVNKIFLGKRFTANYQFMGSSYVMGAKECCRVLDIKFEGTEIPAPKEFEQAIKRTRLEIHYQSFYGDSFYFDSGVEQ
ncbi:hypothetical protein [Vibrio caribbeanicus]|uniref:Uncharacterized protein n=1 Tax=Vibrio caribbeanicus ATCC BAA-2122 TaxID=796620 RepID=E3BN29_9VIBR|nr:hypothetical protein [Vibrio caribbeanicus]EFP95655.1 hypothetical protein VIBC2010_11216 [Vibrio caribbeanicus ATCC BAA-2122]